MAQNIHAASNAIIANYMNKEVTITMTRQDAMRLGLLLRDELLNHNDTMSDNNREHLRRLHLALATA